MPGDAPGTAIRVIIAIYITKSPGAGVPAGAEMSKDKDKTARESKEFRVLRAMKSVLTDVIKDTTTTPGMVHPLSDKTIENIRQCLMLITARETELLDEAGETREMRPRYADEPEKNVVVPISRIGKAKKRNDDD